MDSQAQSAEAAHGTRTMSGALRACERALSDGAGNPENLREPLRLLAVCARRAGMQPEGMLIQLKRVLAEHAKAAKLPPTRADNVREQVVGMAIEAYFSDGAQR